MKKLIGILLVFALAALAACGKGKKDDALVIAGIYKLGDNPWFIHEANSSKSVVEAAGGTFMSMDAKMETSLYMQLVDTCIAQKVDGVLVCIPDQNLSRVTVQKLTEANIPVIAVDDALQDENGRLLAPWVGIDAYNIGKQAGEWGANYITGNNLAADPSFGIMFLTAEAVSSIVPRTQGQLEMIQAALPQFPAARMFRADSDGTVEKSNTAAAAVITGNPQIKKWLIFGINDEGAVGASRALEAAGLAAGSVATGLGGYLAPDEFAKPGSPFKAAAYFSARDVGAISAKALIDHIQNGTPIPERHAVGARMIVPGDDLRSVMPEYF
ncbi:MAG: substrate-binding domain-containing protein [Spirochaetaceae bacterium]|nr:substrate-binding domain-containing protein [Spirochaetaceae bacterium]